MSPHDIAAVYQSRQQGKPFYHPMFKCFMLGKVRLQGVRNHVSKLFFPVGWKPERMRGKTLGRMHDGLTGMERGSEIDRQLSQWANAPHHIRNSTNYPYHTHHKFTNASILKMLGAPKDGGLGWRPHKGQVAVCDPASGIGTGVDLVMLNQHGETILVEVKYGYVGCWAPSAHQPHLKEPLEHKTVCMQNFSYLQLAFTSVLYELTYGQKPADCFVLHVTQNSQNEVVVQEYRMPAWVHDVQKYIHEYLRQCTMLRIRAYQLKMERAERKKAKLLAGPKPKGEAKKRNRKKKQSV